jgi:hypothetical protein
VLGGACRNSTKGAGPRVLAASSIALGKKSRSPACLSPPCPAPFGGRGVPVPAYPVRPPGRLSATLRHVPPWSGPESCGTSGGSIPSCAAAGTFPISEPRSRSLAACTSLGLSHRAPATFPFDRPATRRPARSCTRPGPRDRRPLTRQARPKRRGPPLAGRALTLVARDDQLRAERAETAHPLTRRVRLPLGDMAPW